MAAATCNPSALAGHWDSYSIGDSDGEPFWERCELRFNGSGTLLPGSVCRTDTNDRSTLTGRLILKRDCQITGSLTQKFPGEPANNCTVPQATLSKGQQFFSGVGTCKGSKSLFSFTMIRN